MFWIGIFWPPSPLHRPHRGQIPSFSSLVTFPGRLHGLIFFRFLPRLTRLFSPIWDSTVHLPAIRKPWEWTYDVLFFTPSCGCLGPPPLFFSRGTVHPAPFSDKYSNLHNQFASWSAIFARGGRGFWALFFLLSPPRTGRCHRKNLHFPPMESGQFNSIPAQGYSLVPFTPPIPPPLFTHLKGFFFYPLNPDPVSGGFEFSQFPCFRISPLLSPKRSATCLSFFSPKFFTCIAIWLRTLHPPVIFFFPCFSPPKFSLSPSFL